MSRSVFLIAAIAVLERAQRPMRTADIFREAVAQGLLPATGAKTPELTMAATLYTRADRGSGGELVRVAPGLFALRPSGLHALLVAADELD